MEFAVAQFVVFVLVFLRVASLIVAAPFTGHVTVPAQVKVGLSIFLAYVLLPIVGRQPVAEDLKLAGFVVLALKEVFIGLTIGFVTGLLFLGLQYSGELMAFVMGLSIANIFDPENAQSTPVIGELMYLMGVLVFLAINGHHFILETLVYTFRVMPLGAVAVGQPAADRMIAIAGSLFVVGVKLAAPVLIAIFLTMVALAIMSRVMPQANIFVISMPITIGVGFVVLMASAPMLVFVFKKLLTAFERNVLELVQAL